MKLHLKHRGLALIMGVFLLISACSQQAEQNDESAQETDSIASTQDRTVARRMAAPASFDQQEALSFALIEERETDEGITFNLPRLDSMSMRHWSDQYMPKGLAKDHLYEAFLFAREPAVGAVNVSVIYTAADDWSRLHMITYAPDSSLIDAKELGENFSYLLESTDEYYRSLSHDVSLLRRTPDSYELQRTEKTTIDYQNESRKDSVSTVVKNLRLHITPKGKIEIEG